jgi:hypothetical protein
MKIIKFTTLTINHNKRKNCECDTPAYEVDSVNREVSCKKCGAIVEPFEAIYKIAKHYEKLQEEVNRLLEQKKELAGYKPWLLTIRKLEKECRNGIMVLGCPHCHKGILFEEMTYWVNKERELQRREKEE